MVNLTIDGRAIQAAKGTTVLDVARENGIYIPTLCYHPAIKPIGACRLCVVDAKPGPPRPVPSCVTQVSEGMEVVTNSERVQEIRREILKLVLINHALDCPVCDRAGECELQELVHRLGVDQVDYEAFKKPVRKDFESHLIERHPDRCVTCGRCVNVCKDRVGAMGINFAHRGYFTEVETGLLPLDCEFCGSCIDICPVGALINKQFKYSARAWEVERTEMVCPFCGGGCHYYVHTRNGSILRVVNEDTTMLCGRGRFDFGVVASPDRLKTPLIKKDGGEFKEASWDEALDFTARKLKEIITAAGPGFIYGIGSPRATNEANFLFQKFFRAGLGSNQMDNPGRYTYMRAIQGLAQVFGRPQAEGIDKAAGLPLPYHSPLTAGPEAKGSGFPFVLGNLSDLPKADCVLVVGADVTPEMPPLGWALLQAKPKENFRLIVANSRQTKFDRYAHLSLRCHPGSERLVAAGLIKAMLADNPELAPAIPAQGLAEFKEALDHLKFKDLAKKTGLTEKVFHEAAALLAQAQAPAIIFGSELLAQEKGQDNAVALADLFLLVGKPGAPGSALYPVAEKANTLGVTAMGVLPDHLPGFLPLDADGAVAFWGAKGANTTAGHTLPEVIDLLEKNDYKAPRAVYALGGDLLRQLPNRSRVEKALKRLKFLVVQDAFLTDFAKMADVVFPVAIHAEQEGTFLSADGRLGLSSQAISPNGVRPDWQIINDLAKRLGLPVKAAGPKAIFAEAAALMPLAAGLAPKGSLPAPALKADLSGQFVAFDLDAALPGERPFTLIIGKVLQHSGSFTTQAGCGTFTVAPAAALKLNPTDAKKLKLTDGETAKVTSDQGEISVPVALSEDLPKGVVFLPEHFAEPPAQTLTLNANLVRVSITKG